MGTHDPRNEEGGYGAGNLVGSSESGLRAAIESREAVDATQAGGHASKSRPADRDADLGRLAQAPAPGGAKAGTPRLDDVTQGLTPASAPRDARDDADTLDG
ncbi:hypothetical protein [Cognatilysobacter segetis]|uniref:hypothetical protein n=1 Tax=Cognatilysobacter segetis TaxID=2492394 RepID=UPI0010604FCC|nr:hypothetical protein [Lysobacter segetis]